MGNGTNPNTPPSEHHFLDEDEDSSSPGDPNRFNAYLNRGSELWTHWSWLGGQGKMSLMRCNYCLVNKQLKNAPKCRRHLIKCPKTPDIVRRYFEKKEVEATRVSALMRELRSKEIKFPRPVNQNNKVVDQHNYQSSQQQHSKFPIPTANDLKHLQSKQQQQNASINSVIVKNNHQTNIEGTQLSKIAKFNDPPSNNHNNHKSSSQNNQLNSYQMPIKAPKNGQNVNVKSENNQRSSSVSDNTLFELSLFYQQIMSMVPTASNNNNGTSSESVDLSNKSSAKNYHGSQSSTNKLKRRLSQINHANNNGSSNGHTNKENKEHSTNKTGTPNNTVVINLDEVHSLDESVFFNTIDNGFNNNHHHGMNGNRKKAKSLNSRETVITNGRHQESIPKLINVKGNATPGGGSNGVVSVLASGVNGKSTPTNGFSQKDNENNFSQYKCSNDIDIVQDDLNDLLASALISTGIDFNFISNPYFQKYISQLVSYSAGNSNKNYHLPSVENLSLVNLGNLVRKFEYETAKRFSECDSIIVSFDWNKDSPIEHTIGTKNLNVIRGGELQRTNGDLDVNLLISSSNVYSQLFFKTISFQNKTFDSSSNSDSESQSSVDVNLKSLNNQVDSLINKIGSDRINAVILPYDDGKSSELIYSYLSACHNHIVPLTNSYQLFHHLLCDICRIPSIHKLLTQCINLFQELAFNFTEFQEANQQHWKRVFESDNMKISKHFLKDQQCSTTSTKNNTYWISLNLVLCWFLVAKSSIIELLTCPAVESTSDSDKSSSTNNGDASTLLEKLNLEPDQIEEFFNQISVLFNFLTPFINAMHLIENESTVISDIIQIYFDVKLTINNNHFFDGISSLCDKTERQSIDCILHNYLQEQNFSRFFFLAYYLDPRYRSDKRIEENEDLIAQVYDTLFSYANALGCVNNETEDREKLADSLDEFRSGSKLYGMQLLKCPKSPIKFWKHLRRFPASAKLAYCATRLLSILTRSMLLAAPVNDKCTSTLYNRIITVPNEIDLDPKTAEKILPVKSYLMSQTETIPTLDDGTNDNTSSPSTTATNNNNDDGDTKAKHFTSSSNDGNISNIISNVIQSLNQYSLIIAQPFSNQDLSCLLLNQTSN